MTFAESLKRIISDKHLRQADLCRMTGIQTSLMSEYLGGKKSPTIGNAIAIADALDVSLDFLVGKRADAGGSDIQKEAVMKLKKMPDEEVRAVLAFIDSLEEVESVFGEKKGG